MTTALVPWILAAALGVLGPFLDDASREARAGLDAYEQEQWVDAVTRLLRAREAAKGDPVIDYDLGAAAYRSGDLQTAAQSFAAAAGDATLPAGAAAYNLGNTFAQAGQLEAALGAYREALRSNPDDEDARHNFEVTLARLQQQQEEQDQQDQQQDQQQQDQDQDQDQQDQEQNQDQQDQEQQQGDSQEQQDPEGQQDQQEEQPRDGENQPQPQDGQPGEEEPQDARPRPGEEQPLNQLTREQALRLLDAVTPEERELLRARLEPTRKRRAEKDW